jgi:Ca-activated chloride channel family protein
LEEAEAALDRYMESMRGLGPNLINHPELRYRIYYNMGIIFFEMGEYIEAAQAFRNALILDGSRLEAKRNLELSLLTIARSPPPQPASSYNGADIERESLALSTLVLFEYLRQKEQERWRSREWAGESDSFVLDY